MATKDKELVTKESALPALPDAESLKEILTENLGGLHPTFEVIKIPTGGGTAWTLVTDEGEEEPAKELAGVILHHYNVRAYWRKRYGEDGGNQPPDCFSLDAKHGSLERNAEGEFGACSDCKWAQFGTAKKPDGSPGRGQACSLKHRVFLLMPERSVFPYLIPLSTMSATKNYEGSISTYAVKQSGKGRKLTHVKTRVKLIKDRNSDGVEYAKAQFFFAGELSPEESKQIDGLRATLLNAMVNKPIEEEEAEPEEASGEQGTRGPDPWDKK